MSINDYSPSDFEPHVLTKSEKENPYWVIHEFFDNFHLPEARNDLWEWLQITVCEEFHTLSSSAKSNIIFFYEHTEKLIEAAHIIHKRTKEVAA